MYVPDHQGAPFRRPFSFEPYATPIPLSGYLLLAAFRRLFFWSLSMPKIRKSAEELKQMALQHIRAYRGCGTVAHVGIHPIIDDRAGCNWSISVLDLGEADGDLAHRAAIEVHDSLSSGFDLRSD